MNPKFGENVAKTAVAIVAGTVGVKFGGAAAAAAVATTAAGAPIIVPAALGAAAVIGIAAAIKKIAGK